MSSEEDWKKVESFSSFVEIFQTRITQETGIKDIEAISKDQKIHFLYFLVRSFHHMIKRHNLGSQEKEKILKNFSNSNINLSIRSQLPISKGIGSSASFLVTVSACLLVLLFYLLIHRAPGKISNSSLRPLPLLQIFLSRI